MPTYKCIVDGQFIRDVELPDGCNQKQRDEARRNIANELHVPVHYLRLHPPHQQKKRVA